MVVPGLSKEAILGATSLQKWRIKLDFEHDTVIIYPKIAKAILKNLKKEALRNSYFLISYLNYLPPGGQCSRK
jgi:hypothetical protein